MRPAPLLLLSAMLLALLAAGWIAPYSYDAQFRDHAFAPPSRQFLLGTDALGRDRLSRLLYGGRISMLMAPLAALLAVSLAVVAGLSAACIGGWWAGAVAAVTDLCLSLPWLFLLLAVRAMLPLNATPEASVLVTFGLLGLLGWAGPSRIVLAAVKRHLDSEFVLSARAAGCPLPRIALVHVLPHLRPVAAGQFWVAAPAFLLSEANLGLLGLGVAEPVPSWGALLRELESVSLVAGHPWIAAPLLALVTVVCCCHFAMAPPVSKP